MKILLLRSSRGAALVLNLIGVAVFALLGVVVYNIVRYQVREAVYQKRLVQAHYIAETGLEDALATLYQNPNWRTGFDQKEFAGGYYTVSLSTAMPPVVTATGYSPEIFLFGRVVKTVSGKADISYSDNPIPNYAILTTADINIESPVVINAYDPAFGISTGMVFITGASVRAGDDIKTADGSFVNGIAYYYHTEDIGKNTVLGSSRTYPSKVTLPDHSCPACQWSNDNLTGLTGSCYKYVYTGSKHHKVGSYDLTDLYVDDGATCNMQPGVYYFTDVTVKGTLNVDTTSGTVTVYFSGKFDTDGSCSINNLSMIPSRLKLYGESQAVQKHHSTQVVINNHTVHCTAPLHAYIEEANSNWRVESEVYGRVWGNNVTFASGGAHGTVGLHLDIGAYQPIPFHSTWAPGTWGQSYKRQ